uniref:Ig-like domain-containing protein n=1 Tax=Cyprinodon variegatus TaxID=28743 RepID=A0A3Q2D0H2_CYPVA
GQYLALAFSLVVSLGKTLHLHCLLMVVRGTGGSSIRQPGFSYLYCKGVNTFPSSVASRIRVNPEQSWKLLLTVFLCCLLIMSLCKTETLKEPVVTVCPVKTEPSEEGKTALMCLASDMFPPVVQISWKRQEKNSQLEQQPPAKERQVEVSGSQRSAMVWMVNDEDLYSYEYICEVEHIKGNVRKKTQIKGMKAEIQFLVKTGTF